MAWIDEQQRWLGVAAEHWLPRAAEPLCLRIWLRSAGVSWDPYDGLTIEGALQSAVVALEAGAPADDVFADCPPGLFVDIPIPIADEERTGRKIACASWAQPAPTAAETMRYKRQRARPENMPTPGGMGIINTGQGEYKSSQIPVPTLSTPYVDFFVRGDRERISVLVRDLSAIGRARSGGGGAVLGTEILPDPEDRSLRWMGRPMRSIPVADEHEAAITFEACSYDLREQTARAPYWHRSSRTLCAVPVPRLGVPS